MTFWDHLDVLRKSVFRIVVVVLAAAIGLFAFKDFLFDGLILAPSRGDFFLYRWIGADFSLPLVNIEVTAQFMIHMKMAFLCAIVLTFPYMIFMVWRFIAPALYENEKKKGGDGFIDPERFKITFKPLTKEEEEDLSYSETVAAEQ